MKNKSIILGGFILSLNIQAQNEVTVNKGVFSTKNGVEVATMYDFVNHANGSVINDGSIYFYGDYTNEGLFSFSTYNTSGYVVFEGKNKPTQTLSGNSPSFFYDVLFNKHANEAFYIQNEIENNGTVNLYDGVLFVDNEAGGNVVFMPGATFINASDTSFVDGKVVKIGNDSFKFPIGKSGIYRHAAISAPPSVEDQYSGEYFIENSNLMYPHANRTAVIDKINTNEYWVINKMNPNKGSIILTLSWDDRTTPSDLISNNIENLRILRWDKNQKLWVNEGGIVDQANKTITSPVDVNANEVFTLGIIKNEMILPGDIVVYNAVSSNGIGLNNYLKIDNIENFPNNSIRIFDRWGVEVFSTKNYGTTGNVFKGYSTNKMTFGKSEMLPTGTYYYILEYEYLGNGSSQMIRKAGYLHLESN